MRRTSVPSPSPNSARRLPLAFALAVACPIGAAAQDAGEGRDVLPPQRIEAILSEQGYVGITDLRRRGSVWVAEVAERNGRRFRAVVDATSGEVSGLRQLPGVRPLRTGAVDTGLR